MMISELIVVLEEVLKTDGDMLVGTHNDPYLQNQWVYEIENMEIRTNPEPNKGTNQEIQGKILIMD